MVEKRKKHNIIDKFKEHSNDTGSVSVQIALLTERINYLTEHLKEHKKDFHSRRGLLMLVGRRRHFINYLKKEDPNKYNDILKDLKLHK
ncbi:MAG: 30S ribosomal protein S15 [Candidatus Omnitrophota bacterium]